MKIMLRTFCTLFFSLGTGFLLFSPAAAEEQTFDTRANYVVMIDLGSNTTLYQKNADIPTAPSSMSKLMTIYLVLERLKQGTLKLNDTLFVSEYAWRKQGSKMFVNNQERVTVENLLRGVIVQSGNDACIVLAEGLMGSEESFVMEMNKKAKQLGLKHSHFVNASGWPDPGHEMSVRDLAILAEHLINDFPEYYHYFGEREFSYNNIRQPNRNTLLFSDSGVDGLKTGHTDIGGYGVVVSAKRGERRIILVVNGLKNQSERHGEVERLLNYGFQHFTQKTIFEPGKTIAEANLWLGSKSHAKLTVASPVKITLPSHEMDQFSAVAHFKEPLIAPVHQGDTAGHLTIAYTMAGEKYHLEYPLVIQDEVKRKPFVLCLFSRAAYWIKKLRS